MAKQFVPVTPAGNVIGDGILFRLDEEEYVYVGRAPGANWLEFQGETGGYDVEIRNDPRSPSRPYGKAVTRDLWRFQIQGPNAWPIIEKLNGGTVEQLKFFRMSTMNDRRRDRAHPAPRHGRRAGPGDLGPVRELRQDPRRHPGGRPGVRPGARAARAPTPPTPSSPAGSPPRCRRSTPARSCGPYREWLGADSYEATNAIAGSFVSDNIEDYYTNPWELGYGSFVKFDHDFIGREALEALDKDAQRRKVTLEWNADDLAKLLASPVEGAKYQFFDLPNANYGSSNFDKVVDADGTLLGVSMFTGISANEQKGLSLATISPDVPHGAEVRVVWGEPDGGSKKTTVEPHEQFEVRATVSPVPYAKMARETYHEGWRSAGKA